MRFHSSRRSNKLLRSWDVKVDPSRQTFADSERKILLLDGLGYVISSWVPGGQLGDGFERGSYTGKEASGLGRRGESPAEEVPDLIRQEAGRLGV